MSQSRLAYKLKSMAAVVGGAAVGFLGVAAASGNPDFYRDVAMPFVHRIMSPESAHRMAILAARWQLVRGQRKPDPPVLRTELFGLSFENPVGLAAGFDKHGEGVGGLERWGFGFVEVGSVTPLPQPGNPKPRVFRLAEDLAVINRYGFNSVGHDQVLSSLEAGRHGWKRPVGVNLGKNKESASAADDYTQGVLKFGELADYLVINVSSPNTPGLRGLQGQRELRQLLKQVLGARDSLSKRTPVLVKVAPDLSDQEKADIAAVVTSKEPYFTQRDGSHKIPRDAPPMKVSGGRSSGVQHDRREAARTAQRAQASGGGAEWKAPDRPLDQDHRGHVSSDQRQRAHNRGRGCADRGRCIRQSEGWGLPAPDVLSPGVLRAACRLHRQGAPRGAPEQRWLHHDCRRSRSRPSQVTKALSF
uniref:Dihydroorotate dehydrogenase (quinone), mitochondrial n=1 Tax=Ixodes scapularis TaxID=6945 RepID=A0A4D5RTZ7_IXOSC